MITRLTEQKGIDLLQWIAPQLLRQDVQLVILGTGEARYERYFSQLQYLYPEKVSANLFFGGDLANQIYAGSGSVFNAVAHRALRHCPDDCYAVRCGSSGP